MINKNKIFKISYLIKKSNTNVIIKFEKHYVQANQGFNINIILKRLINKIEFEKHSFIDINF